MDSFSELHHNMNRFSNNQDPFITILDNIDNKFTIKASVYTFPYNTNADIFNITGHKHFCSMGLTDGLAVYHTSWNISAILSNGRIYVLMPIV